MEESRHGSNPQHQPSRPNSSRFQCSRFLSSHFYPFVGSNFSPPLCPPLSSLCHLVQLHRKKKHPTLYHLPHRQHGNDYRACPDVRRIRPAPPAGPYTHGRLADSKRLPQPADTCRQLSQLRGVQS